MGAAARGKGRREDADARGRDAEARAGGEDRARARVGGGVGRPRGRRGKTGGGEGGARPAGVRLRGAQDWSGGGQGRSGRSPHSPPGGRRRRKSRSPCSGWGAAATGVQGPGCGRRAAEPLRAGGSGGRAERGRTREGSPRLEVMRGSACCVPGSVLPGRRIHGRAELAMQLLRPARRERRESRCGGRWRRRAGTRPAPRPDAQFGSCLGREGGRAARAVGRCSLWATGSRRRGGAGAGHCGSSSPSCVSEAHKGLLADSNPHRASRRLPGFWGRCLRDLRLLERGRCGGLRRLRGGGGAARAVAPWYPRGRGAGVAPAGGGGAGGLGPGGR